MSKTRDNHYVPQWHQKGFIEGGKNKLNHLKRKTIDLPDGTVKTLHSEKTYTPAQCFYKTDLYTTFFGSNINDEIERKLFGNIDDSGSKAVKAFLGDDQSEWHNNFQNFFIYLDAQKLRTPKGLDWIQGKYPSLEQNDLMREMQAVRTLHCTLWGEGVREFVSAENSDVKFILSDHPVSVYNYACPPDSVHCAYPNDPDIALKGTQTIFPLDKNRCLILTNLEYAQDPDASNPLEHRTNATKMRNSMVNTIEFINYRKLTAEDVTKINHIIKSRSNESIAAGLDLWLHPENIIDCDWADLRSVLLPSRDKVANKVEMFAGYDDGSTYYQDAFGRTTPQHDFLDRSIDESTLGRNHVCGCGSGKKYKKCCYHVAKDKRTTWTVASVRERNLALCKAIKDILGLNKGKTWTDVRREITEDQIADIYQFYAILWPSETDIYSLLPKPDGKFRAIYSGILDARTIGVHALGMASNFDELLIQSPMVNPNNVNPEFSPVKSPRKYKYQALKDFLFMLNLEPLIHNGIINLIPDPNNFDLKLHREVMDMARDRRSAPVSDRDWKLHVRLSIEDILNSSHMMPREVKTRMLMEQFSLTKQLAEETIETLNANAETAPLMLLQPIDSGEGGQLIMFSMGPNYEMGLFIAQVTGSVILTDSETRWNELQAAQHRVLGVVNYPWNEVYGPLNAIALDYEVIDQFRKSSDDELVKLRYFLKSANNLIASHQTGDNNINQLSRKAMRLNDVLKNRPDLNMAKFTALSPEGGFYDTTVQRLLLKSNCPQSQYLDKVNSVYFIGM